MAAKNKLRLSKMDATVTVSDWLDFEERQDDGKSKTIAEQENGKNKTMVKTRRSQNKKMEERRQCHWMTRLTIY